ncbi:hypothetical protein [Ferrimicrobium acidiphilum]|jgi:hypothetical protein|uniref:hypothetical protein n=1 Tax=Ferrimicrobium acidiphilum TaxID=121039 RepID=UPI0023F30EA5|nr:hypothetical protein [Ferrimicrobium acidiphilum]MCL5054240.1 hypothetical protein [Gammaproteobacteria bacterium]
MALSQWTSNSYPWLARRNYRFKQLWLETGHERITEVITGVVFVDGVRQDTYTA